MLPTYNVLRDSPTNQELSRLLREVVAIVPEQVVSVPPEPVLGLSAEIVLEQFLRHLGLPQVLHLARAPHHRPPRPAPLNAASAEEILLAIDNNGRVPDSLKGPT